ncbi:hypothetical protein QYE76_027639 [Lolium multiflorum]|uniref:Uncharacterized protein n=1 Tax=Lolium multiflorum TaxID=4521 RepID=A0AAD8VG87_LOLMU|nr:hypothetical protein QYE76_027639 [Lolium multiflorum]
MLFGSRKRKEAVELAVVGLSSSIKEVASQADYPSLAHMVQKLSYEQRHPDVYQDKFKRVVTMVDAGEDEGPPRGFDFDVTKTEQIFDLLLAEKHIKIPEGHKFPTVQELNGKPYCKWHNTFTHTTNACRVWRQQIQVAIENGRLIFNQYAMKVDTHPFPAVNMVEFTHLGGCQPDFSANISMVELGHHSEKDGDEDSCSQQGHRGGRSMRSAVKMASATSQGEVKNIRYQRPLSDHLLNKYGVHCPVYSYGSYAKGPIYGPLLPSSRRPRRRPPPARRRCSSAAGGTFIVLIFFVVVVVIAVEVAQIPRPGAMTLGRRLLGEAVIVIDLLFLLLHLLGGGPFRKRSAFFHRFLVGKEAEIALPIGQGLVVL